MDGPTTQADDPRDALIEQLQRAHDDALATIETQEEKYRELENKLKFNNAEFNDKIKENKAELKQQFESKIQELLERIQFLLHQQFGKRSERFNPDQYQLFNEAELTEQASVDETGEEPETTVDVKPHTRTRSNTRKPIPDHLPRVEVHHELDEQERQCACGCMLERIAEDVQEQLSIVPRLYFVTRHIRGRYACSCKESAKNAPMPAHPLPGAQVTPVFLAHVMVSKLTDGLPLYRQEKQANREGLELPRAKLARWFIRGSGVFQPVLNRLMDAFFDYDIAMSDDTRIRVLKTDENNPRTQSALWIRRGGPPDKPVVLVDYKPSKSGEAAYSLLEGFQGTLVCDGASNFNLSVQRNGLTLALCNDHARRRFKQVHDALSKAKSPTGSAMSIATEGLRRYKKLYDIERRLTKQGADAQERLRVRKEEATPLWEDFLAWADKKLSAGVRHTGTTDALKYLLKHAEGLQTYCSDGRLPISNIKAEHVAKTIAIARKNFLFSDTEAGAEASARAFSVIETARANAHNPHKYLSVLLTELPNVESLADIDALLPWTLTPEAVETMYAEYPTP